MSMLAAPDTITGPLTAADLAAARKHSTGRVLAAGCDQQGRFITRRHPGAVYEPWRDTVPTDYGSADALGDDQAERHSAWGAIDESAAPAGGKHREPSRTMRDAPGLLASLLWPLGVVASVAAAVALLPPGWFRGLIG